MTEASKPPLPPAFYQVFHRYLQLILMAISIARIRMPLRGNNPSNDGTFIPEELVSVCHWDYSGTLLMLCHCFSSCAASVAYVFPSFSGRSELKLVLCMHARGLKVGTVVIRSLP
jgi:hypothetical protein